MSLSIPVISLFSGSGGLDLGFEQAGFQSLAAYDVFQTALETYNFNRTNSIARFGDVSILTGEMIAAHVRENNAQFSFPFGIIGGPPCQAFSRSNVYPRQDDLRRTLPGHFARLIAELNTVYRDHIAFFVFENVQGLTFKRHEEEFARFRFLFEDAGFYLFETMLNARDYGVAQDRPRVFIVGLNKRTFGRHIRFEFPPPLPQRLSVHDAFQRGFGNQPWPEPAFFTRALSSDDIPFHPNHWTMTPKSAKFSNGSLREGEIRGRSFRVLAWNKPSWTVAYGHREIHVHPSGRRRLSIFEAMLLQGYPVEYVLKGTLSDQVKLVSDAVPPPLAQAIATRIRQLMVQENLVTSPTYTGIAAR
jgi:DNA (cytosine-5)-methyltransferase 1